MLDVEPIKFFMLAIALSVTRFAAVMTAMPVFGNEVFGGVIAKNTVMLSLAMILVPMVLPMIPQQELGMLTFFTLMIKEGLVGMIIGFLGGFLFYVVQSVGYAIDSQRGASIASVFDPATGSQTSILGNFMMQILVVLFFVTTGFLSFLTIVYDSYVIWPPFSMFPVMNESFLTFFLNMTDEMFRMVATFGGPILFTLFLAEFGLGMITRFAPQLNVFFLAMPVKSALAMFFLIIYMSFLTTFFKMQLVEKNYAWLFIQNFLKDMHLT